MNRKIAIALIIAMHFVGAIGMFTPFREWFIALTPLNLLTTFFLLIYFTENRSNVFYAYTAVVMLAGFIIEVIGVNTGWPFGTYSYGKPLGIKLLDTPLLIGVNWFILTYIGALLFKDVSRHKVINALLCALTITGLDVIIEPVAINLGFWNWASETIPLQNYLTWAVCIFTFSLLFYSYIRSARSTIANWVLLAQVLFFVLILLGIRF